MKEAKMQEILVTLHVMKSTSAPIIAKRAELRLRQLGFTDEQVAKAKALDIDPDVLLRVDIASLYLN
jgi:aminoglycoside phosphotransferase (APT) family kinase protein